VCAAAGRELADTRLFRHGVHVGPADGFRARQAAHRQARVEHGQDRLRVPRPPRRPVLCRSDRLCAPCVSDDRQTALESRGRCRLGSGTLYILDPRDDEDFCHEAWFSSAVRATGSHMRIAFAFRWLSKQHHFFCDAEGELRHALAPTDEILAAAEERERARAARAAREEAAATVRDRARRAYANVLRERTVGKYGK
jgi:hypothetical protein